jgi:hypothetical protein
MEQLNPFIGEWEIEAFGGRGRTVFEWALDGQFVVQRAEIPHPEAPDGLMIIGSDPNGDGFLQHYFDSRGVARLYAMSFADGIWTLLRDKPDFSPFNFHQRYRGEFSEDGNAIRGAWETSPDGSSWELDFELNYRRVG